jgi:uncharacterized protein (DUF58 family)
VEDTIRGEDERLQKALAPGKTKLFTLLPYVAAGRVNRASCRVTLPRRGQYRLGPLQVSTRFPLGLVRASTKHKHYDRLTVYPRLGRLSPDWVRLIDSGRLGTQQSYHRQGPVDGDYYGLREWRPGDSRRWIHWRTTAKLGALAVRQFEQHLDRDMAIVLDLWQPDDPGRDDQGRIEYAVSFAATLVHEIAQRGGSHVIVALAADNPGWWAGTASTGLARQTLEQLAVTHGCTDNDLANMLGTALGQTQTDHQVVVISTRESVMEQISASALFAGKLRYQRALSRVVWLEVTDERLGSVFHFD